MKTVLVGSAQGHDEYPSLTRVRISGLRDVLRHHSRQYIHGTRLEAVYHMPRAHWLIIATDSIWEDKNNPGCCMGTHYEYATPDWIARHADEIDLPEEELVRCGMCMVSDGD